MCPPFPKYSEIETLAVTPFFLPVLELTDEAELESVWLPLKDLLPHLPPRQPLLRLDFFLGTTKASVVVPSSSDV